MKEYHLYKTHIEGIADVRETIRVIEKSSASYIHFLKKEVTAMFVYKKHIQMALARLSHFYWNNFHPLLREKKEGKETLLVITGEKGIVGGLYHELVNACVQRKKQYRKIFVVGKKGERYLQEEGIKAEAIFPLVNSATLPSREEAKKMTCRLFERYNSPQIKSIDILSARFLSLARHVPRVTRFLPFRFTEDKTLDIKPFSIDQYLSPLKTTAGKGEADADGFPLFEPSKERIFHELLEKYIDVSFFEILLEAKLSEFAARTVTAESAVKEADRIIQSLTREFLKLKHLTTTQKQIENFRAHHITRI